ncbi:MAG: hypothetical protein NC102_02640 [Clostridium sp.]|nr:hypothetical protein [Clostridium sp.]
MINDPEAIQKFRYELLDIVENLQEQLKRTDAAMAEVASAWKDAQFQKYQREFSKDREIFLPLCKDIEEFESGPLAQLQSILETYNDL